MHAACVHEWMNEKMLPADVHFCTQAEQEALVRGVGRFSD